MPSDSFWNTPFGGDYQPTFGEYGPKALDPTLKLAIQNLIAESLRNTLSPYSTAKVPFHTHNKVDSPQISYSQLSNQPTIRNYGGHVGSGGGKGTPFPTGWSSVKNGTGDYTVTHNLGTTNYMVTANGFAANPLSDVVFAIFYSIGKNSFSLQMLSNGGSLTNTDFVFSLCVS